MMTTTSPTTTETLTRDLLAVLRAERAVHDELLQLAAQERAAVTAPGANPGSEGPTALRAIVAQ